jgi:D-alanyl-D-alanine carboxypeptidase
VDRAGVGGWGSVRAFVIDDLRAMASAAVDAGVPFTVQSAYRSFTRQAAVFDGWVASAGEASALRSSARAGHSEHQLGTTLDLRVEGGPEPWNGSFATTPTGHWLRDNAWHYGFIVSYPEGSDDVTCYAGEAWHVRYVGRDEAAAVSASGVTLREWLWANR